MADPLRECDKTFIGLQKMTPDVRATGNMQCSSKLSNLPISRRVKADNTEVPMPFEFKDRQIKQEIITDYASDPVFPQTLHEGGQEINCFDQFSSSLTPSKDIKVQESYSETNMMGYLSEVKEEPEAKDYSPQFEQNVKRRGRKRKAKSENINPRMQFMIDHHIEDRVVPKGTFVFRNEDWEKFGENQIFRIENRYLLLKYIFVGVADGNKIYQKTQPERLAGWIPSQITNYIGLFDVSILDNFHVAMRKNSLIEQYSAFHNSLMIKNNTPTDSSAHGNNVERTGDLQDNDNNDNNFR